MFVNIPRYKSLIDSFGDTKEYFLEPVFIYLIQFFSIIICYKILKKIIQILFFKFFCEKIIRLSFRKIFY